MKGIMFKEQLFKAIIKGRKTQTRRAIKSDLNEFPDQWKYIIESEKGSFFAWNIPEEKAIQRTRALYKGDEGFKPLYQKGETAYLKEPYCIDSEGRIFYKFDGWGKKEIKWENKMFMPAKYARYCIRIINVRAERVKSISETDAQREGWDMSNLPTGHCYDGTHHARDWFRDLWDSINKNPYDWDSNPWVWVYEFELTTSVYDYMDRLIEEAAASWERVDPDKYINEVRGCGPEKY